MCGFLLLDMCRISVAITIMGNGRLFISVYPCIRGRLHGSAFDVMASRFLIHPRSKISKGSFLLSISHSSYNHLPGFFSLRLLPWPYSFAKPYSDRMRLTKV